MKCEDTKKFLASGYGMKVLQFLRHYFIILQRSPTIQISRSAVDLAYKIHGEKGASGKPVIVFHGLLGSKKNWASMCDKIAKACSRMVIAADVRNHGDSPHADSHTYRELAGDASKLIDTLSLKEPDVIGHSMGGRTVMALALTEPAKVHSMIVVDISPVSTAGVLNDFFPKLIDGMKKVDFQGKTSLADARHAARKTMMDTGLFDSPESLRFILMNVGQRDGKIGWNCNLDALKKHFMDIATFPEDLKSLQYKGPVLFIGGGNSNYIPKDDITGIKTLFPNAEVKYVNGVGHNVHAEAPTEFFNFAYEFLTKHK